MAVEGLRIDPGEELGPLPVEAGLHGGAVIVVVVSQVPQTNKKRPKTKKLLIRSHDFDMIQTEVIWDFFGRSDNIGLSHVIVTHGHFTIRVMLSELVV